MKIREFLTEANWGKGFAVDQCKIWCLGIALVPCYPNLDARVIASEKIRSAVGGSIIDWNDAPERTFAEVKALVERLDV